MGNGYLWDKKWRIDMADKVSATPYDILDGYNGLVYVISRYLINNVDTADLMRVVAVNNDNTVDVIPIVKNSNASGDPIEESVIYGMRYFEWQYGENLISAKPSVGDVGLVLACKKDISQAETGMIGSYRKYSFADGIYIGGICGLGQATKQKIVFDENGITIESDKDIAINCKNANIKADTQAIIDSPTVYVGGDDTTALKQIAKDGDEVIAGNVVVGTIKAASDTVVFTK